MAEERALTSEILLAYAKAALENASELYEEAKLLLDNGHHARAYFLGVACIEEIGKASIAFSCAGRDLTNPKIVKRARTQMRDHRTKITSGFVPTLRLTQKENLMGAIEATTKELIPALKQGREPSMYTAELDDGSIQKPSSVVRPEAAKDVVRLADHCLQRALTDHAGREPDVHSVANDYFFSLTTDQIYKIMHEPEFGPFLLERIQAGNAGNSAIEDAIYDFMHARQKK